MSMVAKEYNCNLTKHYNAAMNFWNRRFNNVLGYSL